MAPKLDPNATKKLGTASGAQGARPSTPVSGSTTAEGKRKASQSPPAAGRPIAQVSRPLKPATPNKVKNLRITAKEGSKEVPLKRGKSARYALVEEIIRKAMRVLESTEGIDSLANITVALLDKYTKRGTPTIWGDRLRMIPDVKKEMAAFIQRLRNNFPEIKIQPTPADDAYTNRFELINNTDAVNFVIFDMKRIEYILPSDVSIAAFFTSILP